MFVPTDTCSIKYIILIRYYYQQNKSATQKLILTYGTNLGLILKKRYLKSASANSIFLFLLNGTSFSTSSNILLSELFNFFQFTHKDFVSLGIYPSATFVSKFHSRKNNGHCLPFETNLI